MTLLVFSAHGIASITLSPGLTLLRGEKMSQVPHLSGRASNYDGESPVASYPSSPANTNEATLEWIVQGTGSVDIVVDYQRGGVHRSSLQIGDTAKL